MPDSTSSPSFIDPQESLKDSISAADNLMLYFRTKIQSNKYYIPSDIQSFVLDERHRQHYTQVFYGFYMQDGLLGHDVRQQMVMSVQNEFKIMFDDIPFRDLDNQKTMLSEFIQKHFSSFSPDALMTTLGKRFSHMNHMLGEPPLDIFSTLNESAPSSLSLKSITERRPLPEAPEAPSKYNETEVYFSKTPFKI